MAIIYGKNTAVDYAAGNIASFGKSYSRMGAAPLDMYEVWYDYDKLVEYASYRGNDAAGNKVYDNNTEVVDTSAVTSYVGQKVAYVNEAEGKIYHYSIELDGTLKQLGADPLNVEALTSKDEGKIPKAFYVVDSAAEGEEGTEGYKPEVGHVEIRWVTPEAFEDTNTTTTLEAADKSIDVSTTKNDTINKDYKVKVNISAVEGNNLSLKEDGLYVNVPEVVHPEYAIRKEEKEGYEGVYHLTKDGADVDVAIEVPKVVIPEQTDYTVTCEDSDHEATDDAPAFKRHTLKQLGKTVCTIDIPKELVVEEGKVKEVTEADKPYTGAAVGDKYIELKIANQAEPLYIPAKDLVEYINVEDTATVNLILDETHKLTADVNISAEAGNSLVAKEDGLYVNAPILPTSEDAVVANQYVTAVDQKDGKVTVSRKQISYNELADLPTIPGTPDFGILTIEGENAIQVINKTEGQTQDKVVKLLIDETNKGNVTLTQTEAGLKAEVELPTIPPIAIADSVDKTLPTENKPVTDKVIASLGAEGHTVTPTVLEVVTKAGWDKITNAGEGQTAVRLISQSEIDKLAKLNLDNGEITISGSVNASQVKELYDTVVNIVKGSTSDLDPDTEGDQLGLGIEKGAQVNKIEAVALPDAVLAINDKQVNIPVAVAGKFGVIKGGDETVANEVSIGENGVGKVAKVSTDSLVNGTLELVLNGGKATGKANA